MDLLVPKTAWRSTEVHVLRLLILAPPTHRDGIAQLSFRLLDLAKAIVADSLRILETRHACPLGWAISTKDLSTIAAMMLAIREAETRAACDASCDLRVVRPLATRLLCELNLQTITINLILHRSSFYGMIWIFSREFWALELFAGAFRQRKSNWSFIRHWHLIGKVG